MKKTVHKTEIENAIILLEGKIRVNRDLGMKHAAHADNYKANDEWDEFSKALDALIKSNNYGDGLKVGLKLLKDLLA